MGNLIETYVRIIHNRRSFYENTRQAILEVVVGYEKWLGLTSRTIEYTLAADANEVADRARDGVFSPVELSIGGKYDHKTETRIEPLTVRLDFLYTGDGIVQMRFPSREAEGPPLRFSRGQIPQQVFQVMDECFTRDLPFDPLA